MTRWCLAGLLLVTLAGLAGAEEVALRNPGFETGALDGWAPPVPEEQFRVTDEVARTGSFALRAHGDPEHRYNSFAHLVQPLDLTPIPGARYEISGWVRGAISPGDKSARLAIRQVSAEGITIRYDEAWLEPDPERWEHVRQQFRAAGSAVAFQLYVILSNLAAEDVIYLDDIAFHALDGVGEPVTANPPAFSGGGPGPARTVDLATDGLTVRLDAATGLLSSLELTAPTPMLLHPPAPDVTRIFIQLGEREVLFTRPLERASDGRSVLLGPDDPSVPLRARVEYTLGEGSLTERVRFEAVGAINQLARLGVRHGFVRERWQRIIGALRPARVIEAGERTVFSYGARAGDLAPTQLDAWQSVTFPMTVLEGEDRWVLIGSTDLDGFVTLAPNSPPGYFPSVQQNPTRVAAGDTFDFALTWRAFPRSEALLRDVWRWYGEHATSADPLLADLFPFRPHEVARTLPPGIEVSAGGYWAREGARIDPERVPAGANVWYFGWHDWINERYPTEGSWWCRVGAWAQETAEGLRAALASYRERGLKCYLYFRQIANLAQRGTVLPESWFLSGPGGALDLYGGGYTLELPPEAAAELGYTQIPWGMYDFGNDDFRAQYLEQVRACMDYYRPAGVAWDMGWRPTNPGILAVQAQAFAWLRAQHPEMRVIANEASGTPSQWFADCILIENGILYGKSVTDYEIAKAFGTQIASIERGHQFVQLAERMLAGDPGWAFPEGRADAERFAAWSMAQTPLPADEDARTKELAFRMNVRAGLRTMGLGAQWAYLPDAANGPRPVPEPLIEFMGRLMALPPLQDSFAVRLNGGADAEDGLYAGAWAGEDGLATALFNDTDSPRTFALTVAREALARNGWRGEGTWSGFAVDSLATLGEVAPELAANDDGVTLTGEIAPFTLLVCEARPAR